MNGNDWTCFVYKKNVGFFSAFEKKAANGKKLERHISPGEAKFLLELMKAHGSNYKVCFQIC